LKIEETKIIVNNDGIIDNIYWFCNLWFKSHFTTI